MRAGLEQISSFVSSHAREVVFLDFNHFYGVQNLHHEKLVAMLKEVFGDKLCPVVFAQEVLSNSNTLNAVNRKWELQQLSNLEAGLNHLFQMLISPVTTLAWERTHKHILGALKLAFDNYCFLSPVQHWFLCFDHLRCRMMVITSVLIVSCPFAYKWSRKVLPMFRLVSALPFSVPISLKTHQTFTSSHASATTLRAWCSVRCCCWVRPHLGQNQNRTSLTKLVILLF